MSATAQRQLSFSWRRIVLLGLLLGLVLAPQGSASAATSCEEIGNLQQGIDRGRELRRQRQPEAALRLFRCIQTRWPRPQVLASMAAAEQALGRWLDAEAHYQEALAATRDPFIQSHRNLLEPELAQVRQHLGNLEVLGPAGATVWIGDRQVAALPMAHPVRLPIGQVLFEVRTEGFHPVTRQAQIQAGRLSRESVVLLPRRVALPPSWRVRKVLGFMAGGLALAAFAGGIAGWALREHYVGQWNDDSLCLDYQGHTRAQTCGDLRRLADQAQILEIVGFVLGGVLAGSAAALLIPAYRDSGRTDRVRLLPGPGQLGLALTVSF